VHTPGSVLLHRAIPASFLQLPLLEQDKVNTGKTIREQEKMPHRERQINHDILRGPYPISALARTKTYFLIVIFAALKVNILSHCW